MVSWTIFIYGALVAAGGLMGYLKAGSKASLISGGSAGILLMAAAFMMRGAYNGVAWWVALVIALLLLARFTVVSLNGFKLMPGGMIIALSLIAIAVLLAARFGALQR